MKHVYLQLLQQQRNCQKIMF